MKVAYFIYLAYFASQMNGIDGSHIKGIEFTSKKSESFNLLFDSEVDYSLGFTTCLRVMFALLNPNTVFNSQNIVSLSINDYSSGDMVLGILGSFYHFQWPSQTLDLQPYFWYAFCTSYDAKMKVAGFSIDGNIIFSDSIVQPEEAMVGNSSELSGMAEWPFVGQISDFNVWNRSLSAAEIQNFVFCYNSYNFINDSVMAFQWSNANLKQIGKYMSIKNILLVDICSHPAPAQVEWFSIPLNYGAATYVGHHLGGEMSLPSKQSDLLNLFNMTDKICRSSYWVPIVRSKENSSLWLHGNVTVNFLPWFTGQPNGYPVQNCVGVHSTGTSYYDVECNEKRCFNVKLDKNIIFHLRGRCVMVENLDSKYVYHFDSETPSPYIFQGFSGQSMITGSTKTNSWDLRLYNKTTDDFTRIAYLLNIEKFPFGTQNWTFFENGVWTKTLFKMSECKDNEFACSDGACISIHKRCDIIKDCSDKSDEMQCKSFVIDDYLKEDPPVKERNGNGTELFMNITVFSISNFDEIHMTYKARFSLNLRWLDWRVTFHNLKQSRENFNSIGDDDLKKLWLPRLIFSNFDENNLKFDTLSSVVVKRIGSPTLNLPVEVNEDEMFEGELNPFEYNRTYEMTLECNFVLEKYPFDHQDCHIDVVLPVDLEGFVSLIPTAINYNGPTILTQFKVFNYTFSPKFNGSWAQVKFTFQRIYLYHLTNTFLPTVCLLSITEMTLFFRKQDLDLAIGLSLTTMLVMYTLYQSISQLLPKTAYLKFIDVWLMFCLMVPLFVFAIQVFFKLEMINKNKVKGNDGSRPARIKSTPENIKKLVLILVPLTTVLFTGFYLAFAIHFYANP